MHARAVHTLSAEPAGPGTEVAAKPPRPAQRQSQGCTTQRHDS
jgi:hypothetical protein